VQGNLEGSVRRTILADDQLDREVCLLIRDALDGSSNERCMAIGEHMYAHQRLGRQCCRVRCFVVIALLGHGLSAGCLDRRVRTTEIRALSASLLVRTASIKYVAALTMIAASIASVPGLLQCMTAQPSAAAVVDNASVGH